MSICEAEHELVMNALAVIEGNSTDWPYASTLQMNFMADVLKDLTIEELKEIHPPCLAFRQQGYGRVRLRNYPLGDILEGTHLPSLSYL